MPSLSDYVPGDVGSTYDWIGFDPRGVGASSPSLHCSRRYFTWNRPSYVPKSAAITRSWLNRSRAYAAACANTRRQARPAAAPDHARHRARHGPDPGGARASTRSATTASPTAPTSAQVYATRYPSRVGRFVLDGVVNPSRVWYAANLDQDRAFDRNMNVFWQLPRPPPGAFHLGKRWRAIKAGYYQQLRALDRKPAAGGRLGPDELADAMLDAGYYVYNWVDLGLAYSALVRKHRGGTLAALYRDANMGDDNSFAMYNAVQCSDAPWPGWARTRASSWAVHRRAPFLTWGNTWYNAPCLTWKAPAHRRLGVSGSSVSLEDPADQRDPRRGHAVLRRAGRASAVPDRLAGRRGRRHHPRELALGRAVRRQHRRPTTCAPAWCRPGCRATAPTGAARACCRLARRRLGTYDDRAPVRTGSRRCCARRCSARSATADGAQAPVGPQPDRGVGLAAGRRAPLSGSSASTSVTT